MRLILVVEDDPLLLRVISRYLENIGYQVLAADGAQRAISLFSENPTGIDLVVTDVNMPETSGMVLAKELKSLRPRVKILFISGHGLDVMSFPDLPPGAQVLPKPFELDVFAEKIKEMLSADSA